MQQYVGNWERSRQWRAVRPAPTVRPSSKEENRPLLHGGQNAEFVRIGVADAGEFVAQDRLVGADGGEGFLNIKPQWPVV